MENSKIFEPLTSIARQRPLLPRKTSMACHNNDIQPVLTSYQAYGSGEENDQLIEVAGAVQKSRQSRRAMVQPTTK